MVGIIPKVDILMATFNGERFVEEQIASIQAQAFGDWRLLVSDDCSTDGTLGIVRRVVSADSRVRIASEGVRLGGAKQNFMHLLSLSEAPYAMFCDQDDVWLPGKVERTLAAMRELEVGHGAEFPLLMFSDMAVVEERLRLVAPSFERHSNLDPSRTEFAHVLAQTVGAGCTFMMNRALVNLALRCVDRDRIIMHDWWVALVASAFGRIGYVEEPLSLYRQHGGNVVGATRYSPAKRIGELEIMESEFSRTIDQAEVFRETYGSQLRPDTRRLLSEYIAIAQENTLVGGGVAPDTQRKLEERGQEAGTACCDGEGDGHAGSDWGVCGGIVTFNPEIGLLERCLESLATQTELVIVFDNHSENIVHIRSLVLMFREAGFRIKLIEAGVNAGMAVALNRIAASAREANAKAVLFLDQDSIASDNLARELEGVLCEEVALASPVFVDRNVDEAAYKGRCGLGTQDIKRAITSGSLLDIAAWEAVGGYDERLFVDWVDNELCDNLRLHGYRIVMVPDASISHQLGHLSYAWSGPGRDFFGNMKSRRKYYRANYPAWRWRDRARSEAITIRKYWGTGIAREEGWLFVRSVLGRIAMLEPHKLSCAGAVLEGFAEGWRSVRLEEKR